MDQGQFTTTFIPKKPLATPEPSGSAPVSRPVGLLSTISVILFFITLLIAGGVYFWEQYQMKNIVSLQDSVAKIEKTFEPESIARLQKVDKQLKNANTLLKNHTVLVPIFDLLESSTLPQVRFTKIDAAFDDAKGLQIRMTGEADGYPSIAQQSDVLEVNQYLKDILFSNFSLNQKGKISFDLSFGVQNDFIDFEKAPIAAPLNTDMTNQLVPTMGTGDTGFDTLPI